MNILWWDAMAVFAATFAADFVWVRYMAAAAAKRRVPAALWSAAIVGLGAFSVVSYTAHPIMILPALAGAFCGTLGAIRK